MLVDTTEKEPYFCNDCKHYTGGLTCKAFPKGIPEALMLDPESHDGVIEGQGGNYTFDPTHEPVQRTNYGIE